MAALAQYDSTLIDHGITNAETAIVNLAVYGYTVQYIYSFTKLRRYATTKIHKRATSRSWFFDIHSLVD